ncbi:MAG: GDSL-type esterase/lipase family protein [Methylomonas sp.]|jgi:lysophospholipase L1-like esterase
MRVFYYIKNYKHTVTLLLSLFLIASLGFNFVYYKRIQDYSLSYAALKLDPFGLSINSSYNTSPDHSENASPLAVLYGDSRAELWDAPNNIAGFRIINRGISGQTSVQILGRFERQIAPLKPKVIILQAGINDLRAMPLFPGIRDQAIITQCQENLLSVIEKARELGVKVIVTTIFPLGYTDDSPATLRVKSAILTVNFFLQSLASRDVLILDSAKVLSDQHGNLLASYTDDGLHLNRKGYLALNDVLRNMLESI